MVRNDRSRWFSTMVQHNGSRCSRRRVRGQALCHCVAFATQRGMSRAVGLGMTARRYQELEVWQLCEEIRQRVLAETTRKLPSWDRSFCDQIRDAAEDATADVAEGFVRFKPREFAQFLGYALSSLAEVRERTRHGHHRGYFCPKFAAELIRLCVRADKAARSLRQYLWRISPDDVPYHPDARPLRRQRRGR